MTKAYSHRSEGSGAIRSPRAPRPLTVLVMSAKEDRRAQWAKFFEGQGMRTIRCAGPQVTTCALEIGDRCPLHDESDLIFYDQESITPALEEQLDLARYGTPIAYARSMRSPGGHEYPVTERVRTVVRPPIRPR